MTLQSLYQIAKQNLWAAGVDSPEFDVAVFISHYFGYNRAKLSIHRSEEIDERRCDAFLKLISRRENREPLQYILGEWEFMGLSLSVGDGVLIPREDTEILVKTMIQKLESKAIKAPLGLDLCAGSGAVSLGVCSLCPDASIHAIELSPDAFDFLVKNLCRYPEFRITALAGDIFDTALALQYNNLDFIVSNPPYIKSEELFTLQEEVQLEPRIALDGGSDGLLFYRAILQNWVHCLKPGGVLTMEIGESQGAEVTCLMKDAGLTEVAVFQDNAYHDRVVCGRYL